MNLTRKVVIPGFVMSRKVGDETVVLNLESGTYFGLDQTGEAMWELLVEGRSLAEVRDAVVDRYEVSSDRVEQDLVALVEELDEHGLVEFAGDQ